jgi:hypothetical protein
VSTKLHRYERNDEPERKAENYWLTVPLNLDERIDWPNSQRWFEDPYAIWEDTNRLKSLYWTIIDYDINIGHFFRKFGLMENQHWVWLTYAAEFGERLQAATALKPLPVSPAAIFRVIELSELWDAKDECGTETVNVEQITYCRTGTKDRYSFQQQCAFCSEGLGLLNRQCGSAGEYVRLLVSQQDQKRRPSRKEKGLTPTEIPQETRDVVFSLLDELAANPLTPNPDRDRVVRPQMKKRGMKVGNIPLGILMNEWKAIQRAKSVRPHRPQRTK